MRDIIPQLFVLSFLISYLLFLVALIWWALDTRLITALKIRSAGLLVQAQKVFRSSIWTFRRESQRQGEERRCSFKTTSAGAR
jgi:hypothetical protein